MFWKNIQINFSFALLCLILLSVSSISTQLSENITYCEGNLPLSQYIALHNLYNQTNGPNWCNTGIEWIFPTSESIQDVNTPCVENWDGIICSCVNISSIPTYAIIHLTLNAFCMEGEIPSSIDMLDYLRSMEMNTNSLYGSIPFTIGNMKLLMRIDLSYNSLTNTIPISIYSLNRMNTILLNNNLLNGSLSESISNMKSLTTIYLNYNLLQSQVPKTIVNLYDTLSNFSVANNQFTGTIPSEIGMLTNLNILDISINMMIGSIPMELCQLQHLNYLFLYSNMFSYTIPSCIGNISSLLYLDLFNNQLNGSIPNSTGLLDQLQHLYLYDNHLSNILPHSLYNITTLIEMDIHNNNITGTIPTYVSNLSKLLGFNIGSNLFYGTLPEEIGNMGNLQYFAIGTNHFYGTVPPAIYRLSNLFTFDISNNHFYGTIPMDIGYLRNVNLLYLYGTQLSGSLPSSIGNLTAIQHLDLFYSHLNGTIPKEIGYLQSMTYAYLYNCYFTGQLPMEIGMLTNLIMFDVASNHLSGSIPMSVGNMSSLTYLYLLNNHIGFTIPNSIGNLTNLLQCDLYNNEFIGTIPNTIGNMKSLQILHLEENNLGGSIPFSIGNLIHLSTLYLHSNQLCCAIPVSLYNLSNLQNLFLQHNSLSGTISSHIYNLKQLSRINIANNKFFGHFPTNIDSYLSKLVILYIEFNYFSGLYPTDLLRINNLLLLDIGNNYFSGTIANVFPSVLQYYYVYSNYLTGTIPISLFNCTDLNAIWLYDNLLYGSISQDIQYTQGLTQLTIHNNIFSGEFFNLFQNDHVILETIDISNNLFSGTISDTFLYQLPVLSAISGVLNCFTGSIPQSFCGGNRFLSVINFDGMGSNLGCSANMKINDNKPSILGGTFTVLGLDGTIPSCIVQLPYLVTLHLSGNNLRGKIPEIPSDSLLYDLALSNNILTGTIPESIQLHTFQKLDLSNNRLYGTLLNDFSVSSDQATLGLAVNRLSGSLPSSLKGLSPISSSSSSMDNTPEYNLSLNILASNVFDCTIKDIPTLDSYSQAYSCGSYELNIASYVWVGFAGVSLLIIAILFYIYRAYRVHRMNDNSSSNNSNITYYMITLIITIGNQLILWWNVSNMLLYPKLNHTSEFIPESKNITEDNSTQNMIGPKPIAETNEFNPKSHRLLKGIQVDTKPIGLNETKAFLIVLRIIVYLSIAILCIITVIVIPVYIVLNSTSSIVSYQYGYVLSITFLHGISPVIAIGSILIPLLYLSKHLTYLIYPIFHRCLGMVQSPSDSNASYGFLLKKYSILLIYHIINITVTVAVNTAYVNAILSQTNITREGLLIIQIGVGLFKLIWNGIYIPYASRNMSYYMSQPRSMSNRFLMSITNFIVAPCIATLIVNQSCFYYIFKPLPIVTSNVFIDLCTLSVPCIDQTSQTIIFSSEFVPSFQYSYACGTALLEAYTPVLIYTYVANGFILPIFRYVTIFYPNVTKYIPTISSVLSFGNNYFIKTLFYRSDQKTKFSEGEDQNKVKIENNNENIEVISHNPMNGENSNSNSNDNIVSHSNMEQNYKPDHMEINMNTDTTSTSNTKTNTKLPVPTSLVEKSPIHNYNHIISTTNEMITTTAAATNSPVSSQNKATPKISRSRNVRQNTYVLRARGRDIIVMNLLHLAVLLTFGLASPILGITIVISMISDYIGIKILIGKILFDAMYNAMRPSVDKLRNNSIENHTIPLLTYSNILNSIEFNNIAKYSIEILVLEYRDMKDSWRGIFGCYILLTYTITIFWGSLFFDMIADYYGIINAMITSLTFGLFLPNLILFYPYLILSAMILSCLNLHSTIKFRINWLDRWNAKLLQLFRMDAIASDRTMGREFGPDQKSKDINFNSMLSIESKDQNGSVGVGVSHNSDYDKMINIGIDRVQSNSIDESGINHFTINRNDMISRDISLESYEPNTFKGQKSRQNSSIKEKHNNSFVEMRTVSISKL